VGFRNAHTDELREPVSGHVFVVLTLYRMLDSLKTGTVASKSAAARWAKDALNPRWTAIIDRTSAGQHEPGEAPDRDVEDTLAFICYGVERSQPGEDRGE